MGAALVVASLRAAAAATLSVEVEGVDPEAGQIFVGVCQRGLGPGDCDFGQSAAPRGTRVRIDIAGIAPGTYAVAAYQDENGNGRLDRTPLGLPLEPYGFSGGTGTSRRPSFEEAAFALSEPGARVQVRLQRLRRPSR